MSKVGLNLVSNPIHLLDNEGQLFRWGLWWLGKTGVEGEKAEWYQESCLLLLKGTRIHSWPSACNMTLAQGVSQWWRGDSASVLFGSQTSPGQPCFGS